MKRRMFPEWSIRMKSDLPGCERAPRPIIWMKVDRLLRSGRQSITQPTSGTSKPFARASTEIRILTALSGLLNSLCSRLRSASGVLEVKTAAMTPA